MYDYSTMYNYGTSALTAEESGAFGALFGAIAAMGVMFYIISLLIAVFAIICQWKIFTKAGKPGWASLIPIYNMVVLFQVANMNPWLLLLMLIPIANIIVMILLYVNLAKAFGKGGGFAVGLLFLNIIFMAILAFDSSEHQAIA